MAEVIETPSSVTVVEVAPKSTIVNLVETTNLINEKVEVTVVEMLNSPTSVIHEMTVLQIGESSGGANSFFPSGW